MPFENAPGEDRKIAVIGGGISGMGAARMLADGMAGPARVTLIEAEPRLGGHARTVMAGRHGDTPVDTGFIVFNRVNYPHLVELFEGLGVPVAPSNMSFGASFGGGRLEYGLSGMAALFAQRRNLFDPRFLGMVRDILRFNARALEASREPGLTIGGLLHRLGTGTWFREHYLLPFSGAIWSTPKARILDFPAEAMLRFFDNHALLDRKGQHQWYTVRGGSVEYVRRLEVALRRQGVTIRTGTPVQSVRRGPAGVQVKLPGAPWEHFDQVIFATHSDDTLRLLADPAEEERAALSAIRYQPNDVLLHSDPRVMPRRRACWSSWVHTEPPGPSSDRIEMSYWMNSLQPIPADDPHFVTLNTTRDIPDEKIHDRVTLRHPVYDTAAFEAQHRVAGFNGARNTWFCGAWMRNGFHEDGLASAVEVVQRLAESRSAGAASLAALPGREVA